MSIQLRSASFFAAAVMAATLASGEWSYSQQPTRRTSLRPNLPNEPMPRNASPPGKADVSSNSIIQPIPLSAKEQEAALGAIDQHLTDDVAQLKAKLKEVLPDELSILAKTEGWTQQNQSGLITALRSGDPTAVYEAWTQGNPRYGRR